MTDSEAPVEALANLPREVAILKIENDSIQALAAARPRDYKAILQDLKDQLEAFPKFADEAVYCKPVGRDKNGVMKFAQGLSIRAAEALSTSYKYNRVSADVEDIKGSESKKIVATFVDLQQGRMWSDATVVSPWYKTKGGAMKRHNDDRFQNVVLKAEKSKLIREVIMRCVPAGLKAELEDHALQHQRQALTDDHIEKILEAWEEKGVGLKELEQLLGKPKVHWSIAERLTLKHLWHSVKDGETSMEEVFDSVREMAPEGEQPVERELSESTGVEALKDKLVDAVAKNVAEDPAVELQERLAEMEKQEESPTIPDDENPFMKS